MRYFFVLYILTMACRSDKPSIEENNLGSFLDNDNDGYDSSEDCDDSNSLVNPSAEEICDGQDNNCNEEIDEGVLSAFYLDDDNDGFGDPENSIQACSPQENYVANGNDCNDSNGDVWPGASEICDGEDNDCDDSIDEDLLNWWYADTDNDGYGDPLSGIESCDPDNSYIEDDHDCDDSNPDIHPDAEEICNGLDDNCDLAIDEDTASDTLVWYLDSDLDGFGDSSNRILACEQPSGYVSNDTDCDDGDNAQYPGAYELCNGEDDNCNLIIDEDTALDALPWYTDLDSDGFGNSSSMITSCAQPSGYVSDSTDCDDGDPNQYPGADELCNGEDDNCDLTIDEDTALDVSPWFIDDDNDGYGDASIQFVTCFQPPGYVGNDTDCDDADPNQFPGADELCNGEDDNCDLSIDEDSAVDAPPWYADSDNDGYGDPANLIVTCYQPSGHVAIDTDCDDTDPDQFPGADEFCNGEDDNCDLSIDEDSAVDAPPWYADSDNDGYGDPANLIVTCYQPSGHVAIDTDCDDTDPDQFPGADEFCNGEDDNCDLSIDEDSAVDAPPWYADSDNDGYGDPVNQVVTCYQPSGHVAIDTDCDDTDPDQFPGADELCNGEDDDCDLSIDEDTAIDAPPWYADNDNDNYGDPVNQVVTCYQPSGYVAIDTDCDDGDPNQFPGADEICNGEDDNCDLNIDEDTAIDAPSWYADSDVDGFGDPANRVVTCYQPSGYVAIDTDCDDGDPNQFPGADEICNGEDDNCDLVIDEGQLGMDAVCVAEDCSEILSDDPNSPDGLYWLNEFSTPVLAYCDMDLGLTLCSENEMTRYGQTRDSSNINYVMEAVLDVNSGSCAIWAVRSQSGNTPFGSLSSSFAPLNTCEALGFVGNDTINGCSYGSSYGNCGYSDNYYRYGNNCGGCSLNDGQYNRYVRQGYMFSAGVISTMSGSVKSHCFVE